MRTFMMKKVTVGSPIVALLLLAASTPPLRASTAYIVDTSGIAFTESGKANPYALFINPADPGDFVGVCCGPSSPVLYQVIDIAVVDVIPFSTYDLSFDVENGTTIMDEVQAVLTLGPEVGSGPYYEVTSLTGTGDWGCTTPCPITPPGPGPYTLSLDNTTSINDGPDGPYVVDNLFDPTGAIPPEPSSLVLLATGLLAMALVMRKRLADGIRQATQTQR
jgi:hypothetical protein